MEGNEHFLDPNWSSEKTSHQTEPSLCVIACKTVFLETKAMVIRPVFPTQSVYVALRRRLQRHGQNLVSHVLTKLRDMEASFRKTF